MTILKIKITIVRMLFVLARGSAHQERNRTSDFTRNEGIQMEKKKTEPKYLRIVEWIKKQVADGVLNVGDRLASENELSAQFGLSRQTVRQATSILEKHAASQPKIYNKGISGNKVFQLRERWEMDCLALQPDVLSILIGVNDYWHTLSGGYKGTVEIYENDLRVIKQFS